MVEGVVATVTSTLASVARPADRGGPTGAGRRGQGFHVASAAGGPIPADDRDAFAEMVAALETSVVSLSAQELPSRISCRGSARSLGSLEGRAKYRRLASDVETNRKLTTLLSDKLGAARIRSRAR